MGAPPGADGKIAGRPQGGGQSLLRRRSHPRHGETFIFYESTRPAGTGGFDGG